MDRKIISQFTDKNSLKTRFSSALSGLAEKDILKLAERARKRWRWSEEQTGQACTASIHRYIQIFHVWLDTYMFIHVHTVDIDVNKYLKYIAEIVEKHA